MAKGTYFSVLASDDVNLPEKIGLLVGALEEKGPTCAAAFGNALIIDENGQQIRLDERGLYPRTQATKVSSSSTSKSARRSQGRKFGTYETLIGGNYLPAMSNVVRTAALSEVGGWTSGNTVEDWEMWLKLSKSFKLTYIDQPVALYRQHELNASTTTAGRLNYASMLLVEKEREFCMANHLADSWLESYGSLVFDQLLNGQLSKGLLSSILNGPDKRSLLFIRGETPGATVLTLRIAPVNHNATVSLQISRTQSERPTTIFNRMLTLPRRLEQYEDIRCSIR